MYRAVERSGVPAFWFVPFDEFKGMGNAGNYKERQSDENGECKKQGMYAVEHAKTGN